MFYCGGAGGAAGGGASPVDGGALIPEFDIGADPFAIGAAPGAIGAPPGAIEAAPESDIGERGDDDVPAADACSSDFSFNAFVSADALDDRAL